MSDHEFTKADLDIPRKKKGEGEVQVWNRLFLKLHPDWLDANMELPSPCEITETMSIPLTERSER